MPELSPIGGANEGKGRFVSVLGWLGYAAAAAALPVVAAGVALALAAEDLCFRVAGRRRPVVNTPARRDAVSVVIPTWNGLPLLQKYLPSVLAAVSGSTRHEVIVVDNASDDGTAAYLQAHFPQVRVLRQQRNLGFGAGSNAGFRAAKNDIVVLLNNDMRVEPDFLAPLLTPFADPQVFAVTCQIYLSDPERVREETGLTSASWRRGRLSITHHVDPAIDVPFPCAYPGGGSSAFDRRKFLELGGFDEVFRPFYYEDTDIGYMAWKRGWKVLYQPQSVVYHDHRATIGKQFSHDRIEAVLQRNLLVFAWKNMHDWRILAKSFWRTLSTGIGGTALGKRKGFQAALAPWLLLLCLKEVLHCRWQAKSLALVSDKESLRRQRGGYFRDCFAARAAAPQRLQVLFVSPYHIEPASHGGAVFMREAIHKLRTHCDVHVLSFVADATELAAQDALRPFCASLTVVPRKPVSYRRPWGSTPRVVREFCDRDFAWAMDRLMLMKKIDLVQIDYIMLAQYRCDYQSIPTFLFEHDLAYQSLGRQFRSRPSLRTGLAYWQLRAYERQQLPGFARVQVCSEENQQELLRLLPKLRGRVDADSRAAIDTRKYAVRASGRETDSAVFLGSLSHQPNVEGLDWLLQSVWPRVLRGNGNARLYVAGSGPAGQLAAKLNQPGVSWLGFVEEPAHLLLRGAVFLAPILSGSGIRVKLLEALASGIPAVATRLGAEGLATTTGEYCDLADTPEEFAAAILRVMANPERAAAMAQRARQLVEERRDSTAAIANLAQSYWREVYSRRARYDSPDMQSVQGSERMPAFQGRGL